MSDGTTANPADRQTLRLATVFTGGVSLAVWMGGVARELDLLTNPGAVGTDTECTSLVRDFYRRLTDVLGWDVEIDVLAGTSAGGINSALLALANASGGDLGGLRDLWLERGAFEVLLRDPAEKSPRSLLQGDGVLLTGIEEAARRIRPAQPVADPRYTWLNVTTTLLRGEQSHYTDSYGTVISDTDHLGLFTFTDADLADPANDGALALAARASASFPGAFEPAFLPCGTGVGDRPDVGPFLPVTDSHYASDGGQLDNQPVGPALSAIFDRPGAADPVRRTLLFVTPSTAPGAWAAGPTVDQPPSLPRALMADLQASRSQSIRTSLDRIESHNSRVQARTAGRDQLLRLTSSLGTSLVDEVAYRDYRAARGAVLAGLVVEALTNRMFSLRTLKPGSGVDLDALEQVAAAAVTDDLPPDLPRSVPGFAALGLTAADDVRAILLQARADAYALLAPGDSATRDRMRTAWATLVPAGRPPRSALSLAAVVDPFARGASAEQAAAGAALARHRQQLVPASYWQSTADGLAAFVEVLRSVANGYRSWSPLGESGRAESRGRLLRLVGYLSGPDPAARLVALHVASYLMLPGRGEVSQTVEFVQISADTRTQLDPRALAVDKLTGLQVSHFGGFYRASWRANDWMWGRLDGAGWVVHLLCSPRRLLDIRDRFGDSEAFVAWVVAALTGLAGGDQPPVTVEDELRNLVDPATPVPVCLSATPMWVAAVAQRWIVAEELACVSAQLGAEADDVPACADEAAFTAAFAEWAGRTAPAAITSADAGRLLGLCQVSKERLSGQERSPLFVKTVTKAAAVATAAISAVDARPPATVAPALTIARQGTRAAYEIINRFTHGRVFRTAVASALALLAGIGLATSSTSVVSFSAAVPIVVGVLLAIPFLGRKVVWLAALVGVLAVLGLVLAGFIPTVDHHLFPWLEKTAVPWLGRHGAVWAAVVLFVLLPPVAWVGRRVAGARRRPAAPAPTAAINLCPAPAPSSDAGRTAHPVAVP